MNRIVLVVASLAASVAMACSGELCADSAAFSRVDGGGVPVNLQPLVVRNVWLATPANQAAFKVYTEDGGVVPTDVRAGYMGELIAEPTTPLTEGASYFVQFPTSCESTDTHLEPFTVSAPVLLDTAVLDINVADSGIASIPQYSGASCSTALESSFANFRLAARPGRAELLPFMSWSLSLLPQDGGVPIEWSREPAGGVIADGGLAYRMNLQLAPTRLLQVWHLCSGVDAGFPASAGAPAGVYRAELTGTWPAGDAGVSTISEPFELADCSVSATGGGAGATGGGVGASGGGAGATGGGAGATGGGAGATGGGSGATGGGSGADAGTGGGGEPGGTGCSTTALALPLLALLAFRRRRD